MKQNDNVKQKILIADDSEINRSILVNMLESEYDLIEVENGVQAIEVLEKYGTDISIVLLDLVMPEMDGIGVLKIMNIREWIDDIPVIMISAENSYEFTGRAFDLGVTDFISRPFDSYVVHSRVNNTILLYAKQKKLQHMVEEQIREKQEQNQMMIEILSHTVEFRNGESGQHVLHMRTLTEMLFSALQTKTDKYDFSDENINLIGTASALHDIGKIAIPTEIINKPGKLTHEEFEIMKTHSEIGAKMLEEIPAHKDHPLLKTAYEICRWHHERYDGKGYPDGLAGEEIPIAAQVTSMADVYDALTSERVYKKALSHDTAVKMILDGQCGAFNPLLLECLTDIGENLYKRLKMQDASVIGR